MDPTPQVFLKFEHGKGTVLDVVSKPHYETDDFKCGIGLFHALSAVMDYVDSSITVRLGSEHYKFDFFPCPTGERPPYFFLDSLYSTHAIQRQ